MARIRSYLNITVFGEASIAIIEPAIADACLVKENLAEKNFRQRIEFFQWLDRYSTGANALDGIADMKIKQFAAEGESLKAREMALLKAAKRYTLAVSLIAVKKAAALNDLEEMLVRRVNKIHKNARGALDWTFKSNKAWREPTLYSTRYFTRILPIPL